MIIPLKSPPVGLQSAAMQEHLEYSGHILHARSQHYYWEGWELLSIKAFFSGRALYNVGNGNYAVDDTSYLVLNQGQTYTITIEATASVESFCLFFDPGFAEEVYRSLATPTEHLLDEPAATLTIPISFFERTYPHDDLVSPILRHLRTTVAQRAPEQGWLYEQFHAIMQQLLQVHYNVYKEVAVLPAARASTREEMYRRLYRAKDYASALFDTPITLNDMAQVAALSPNHFLRTFKELFHLTPYQYVVSKRLEHAKDLLLRTDQSITDICFSLGFESLGSFSWLFHRRIGISPEGYRAQRRQNSDFGEAR